MMVQELPDVLEDVAPTLQEMAEAGRSNANISDETYVIWGTKLTKGLGPYAR